MGVRRRGHGQVMVSGGEGTAREVQQLVATVHAVSGDRGADVEAGQLKKLVQPVMHQMGEPEPRARPSVPGKLGNQPVRPPVTIHLPGLPSGPPHQGGIGPQGSRPAQERPPRRLTPPQVRQVGVHRPPANPKPTSSGFSPSRRSWRSAPKMNASSGQRHKRVGRWDSTYGRWITSPLLCSTERFAPSPPRSPTSGGPHQDHARR